MSSTNNNNPNEKFPKENYNDNKKYPEESENKSS